MSVEKIIFLDIDGPLIPGTAYLYDINCSWEQRFYQPSVDVLKKILEASGAKVVFNTSHNVMFDGLLREADRHGLTGYLHPEANRTTYPKPPSDFIVDREDKTSGENGQRRLACAKAWLKEYAESEQTLWVIFDDLKINHKRAIHVDFDSGLTLKHYNEAAQYLMYKPFLVL